MVRFRPWPPFHAGPDRAHGLQSPRTSLTQSRRTGWPLARPVRAAHSVRRPDSNPFPSHRAALRHVDDRDREVLSRDVRLAVSIDELVLVPEPKSSRAFAPLLNRTGICRHHGPVETRRVLVRLHREPVALGQSVSLRAWCERIHGAYTIPVERHTAAALYDLRRPGAHP